MCIVLFLRLRDSARAIDRDSAQMQGVLPCKSLYWPAPSDPLFPDVTAPADAALALASQLVHRVLQPAWSRWLIPGFGGPIVGCMRCGRTALRD